ncbi:MAG: hypothetical protein WDM90_05635 [Ferruginibacter sp.]
MDSIQVPGVEDLKMDVDLNNPEITLTVDRERALIQGVSSAQLGRRYVQHYLVERYQK